MAYFDTYEYATNDIFVDTKIFTHYYIGTVDNLSNLTCIYNIIIIYNNFTG